MKEVQRKITSFMVLWSGITQLGNRSRRNFVTA
jgi:hypothetical protein